MDLSTQPSPRPSSVENGATTLTGRPGMPSVQTLVRDTETGDQLYDGTPIERESYGFSHGGR